MASIWTRPKAEVSSLEKRTFRNVKIPWTPEAIRWSERLGAICGHCRPRFYSLRDLAWLVDLEFIATEIQREL